MYAWGGPGTVRLIQTKYHQPQIDKESFLKIYSQPYLSRAKQLFGVTDVWATYSWGFSDEVEEEDYAFIRASLPTFQDLGLRTHAYVQGLNLVTAEFRDEDVFCRDQWDRLLPYSKGRSLTCPNNPRAREIILNRVTAACTESFDGVFIDNMLFGLPPLSVAYNATPFFGCACSYCQDLYADQYGSPLPLSDLTEKTMATYLQFRCNSVTSLVQEASSIARQHNKQFGINLYDPVLHTPELYFGYQLAAISPSLSYFLFENNLHPAVYKNGNKHLVKLLNRYKKDTFVVSYKYGIGAEPQFSQKDINILFSEANKLRYFPCLKSTEFTTDGIWHALRLTKLKQASRVSLPKQELDMPSKQPVRANWFKRSAARFLQRYTAVILTILFEQRLLFAFLLWSGLYLSQLKSPRNYSLVWLKSRHDPEQSGNSD